MYQNLILKKKWLKKIPLNSSFQNQNNTGVFFKRNLMRHTILNWNLIWFYIHYQLNVFKQIAITTQNILFVTDNLSLNSVLSLAAKKTNISYVCGNWRGGALTKIEVKENIPDFIINFGTTYTQNFYNEIAILLIPSINLLTNKKQDKKNAIVYNIPFSKAKVETTYFLSLFCIWFIKKNKKYEFYENFQEKSEIDPKYINQLQLINFKKQIYEQWTNKFVYKSGNKKKLKLKNWEIFYKTCKYLQMYVNIYFPCYLTKFFFAKEAFVIQQEEFLGLAKNYTRKKFILKNLFFDFKDIKWNKI